MGTNWLIKSVLSILTLLFIIYLFRQNRKDDKQFEKKSNLKKPHGQSK